MSSPADVRDPFRHSRRNKLLPLLRAVRDRAEAA